MKVIILAAGQGSRLRPLTDEIPKCMVQIRGKCIIERQISVQKSSGIKEKDIVIVTGYKENALKEYFNQSELCFVTNPDCEVTNMVISLMCAREIIEKEEDILISYGDIIYEQSVLEKLLKSNAPVSVIVDDSWQSYWEKRVDNPLDDAESLKIDSNDYLTEIGQKTGDLVDVQSQYIGLMRFKGAGVKELLRISDIACHRSSRGEALWRTNRSFDKMYMTDLLQGCIDEGIKLKAIHINRGWYEVDNLPDLELAERELSE